MGQVYFAQDTRPGTSDSDIRVTTNWQIVLLSIEDKYENVICDKWSLTGD